MGPEHGQDNLAAERDTGQQDLGGYSPCLSSGDAFAFLDALCDGLNSRVEGGGALRGSCAMAGKIWRDNGEGVGGQKGNHVFVHPGAGSSAVHQDHDVFSHAGSWIVH